MKKSLWLCGAACLLALSAPAFAASKPGLWDMSMNMQLAGAAQIPPEAMAQMRALGMAIPGLGAPIRTQVCITPAEAAKDEPPPPRGCRHQNVRRNGAVIAGDLVCDGEMKGTGTFEATQVGDAQFRSKMTFKGTRGGQPADFSADVEGQWRAADCGNVAPTAP
jgi:hypothetical protein